MLFFSIPEFDDLPLSVSKTDMATIVKVMQLPDSGLEIRDRMWLKITISNAVIGEKKLSKAEVLKAVCCKSCWQLRSTQLMRFVSQEGFTVILSNTPALSLHSSCCGHCVFVVCVQYCQHLYHSKCLHVCVFVASSGADVVDWLYSRVEGFKDRRDARKYASSLLKHGYLRHTVNKITFSEQCYYTFGDLCQSTTTFIIYFKSVFQLMNLFFLKE